MALTLNTSHPLYAEILACIGVDSTNTIVDAKGVQTLTPDAAVTIGTGTYGKHFTTTLDATPNAKGVAMSPGFAVKPLSTPSVKKGTTFVVVNAGNSRAGRGTVFNGTAAISPAVSTTEFLGASAGASPTLLGTTDVIGTGAHSLAVGVDGDGAGGKTYVWVDGAVENSNTTSSISNSNDSSTVFATYIGGTPSGGFGGLAANYVWVVQFKRLLTTVEVLDLHNSLAANNTFGLITAAAPDTTAPNLTSPTGTKTGSTTATGTVSTDEGAGILYRLASVNATETAATIKAANLTSAVTATGVQNVTFTGLTANTTYYAHYVQDDAATTVNTSSVQSSASFTTDSLPAAVLSSPAGTATGQTTATATVFTTVGSGTLYYYFSTNTTETSATIKASGQSQAVTATGTQNVSKSGLTASTLYYSHFVQVANALDSDVANGSGFTTASPSAPSLTLPSATSVAITTVTANVTTDTASGTLYAYASINATETAATVKTSGTQKTVTASGAQSVNLTGLTANTNYYLHFVHTGAADSGVSNSGVFTTLAAAAGSFTSHPLVNDTGTVLANVSGWTVLIYSLVNSALLAIKSGLTTSSLGVLTYSDAACVAGTTYRIIYISPTGDEGMNKLVAA